MVGGKAAHHAQKERFSEGLRPSKPPACEGAILGEPAALQTSRLRKCYFLYARNMPSRSGTSDAIHPGSLVISRVNSRTPWVLAE